MTQALMLLAFVCYVAAGGSVGARLVRLSLRTRHLTEFFLGFSLLDMSLVAYPLTVLAQFAPLSLGAVRVAFAVWAFTLTLGWAALSIFTQRTFRPGVGTARALSGALLAFLAFVLLGAMLLSG
jgi:hypothetical protein